MAGHPIATYSVTEFDIATLAEAKADDSVSVSVCLPARNEAKTVGPIIATIRDQLMGSFPLVDELLVIDDHSTDRTAAVAVEAGAEVVGAADVLSGFGTGHGKGEALWKSLYTAKGDLVVWCDADIHDFDARFIVGLLGPLLTRPDIGFVKGYYDRPIAGESGGGRVTELAARPALSLLFPDLAGLMQPLAGEYAGRRAILEQLPFITGYGVDVGLVIDVAARFGTRALAQVDLGVRHHRNRTLHELGPQALSVLQAVFGRAGVALPQHATLLRPDTEPVTVANEERPALISVPGYRRQHPR